jgi:hypothetical protein
LSLFVSVVLPSSHSEAPESSKYKNTDATDFYMFRSYEVGREAYVTFVANYYPLQDTYGGPNYFTLSDEHFYEIYVDNNGDAVEDMTFQFMFGYSLGNNNLGITVPVGDKNIAVPLKFVGPINGPRGDESALNWIEYYQLGIIRGTRDNYANIRSIVNLDTGSRKFRKPFDNVGHKAIPNYDDYTKQFMYNVSIPGCRQPGRVFVGQRKDSFAVNLGPVFDLVNFVPINPPFPGGINNTRKHNELKGKAVTSLVLEVPITCLVASASSPIIGGWTAVRTLSHDANDNHIPGEQTNRLGNPLINELVIGLPDKDLFNTQQPKDDAQFAKYVTNPTFPTILNLLFLDAVNSILSASLTNLHPDFYPRTDIVAAALTGLPGLNQPANVVPADMLRLNTAINTTRSIYQNSLGVIGTDLAGYPNGRRPGDDVVDILLRVLMGVLCHVPTLTYCQPNQAPVGNQPISDGAPQGFYQFDDKFPYLRDPRTYSYSYY